MAKTSFGVNHPMAVKLWSKRLHVEALKASWIGKFLGSDTNSLIYMKDELSKAAGDQITYGLRVQLAGDGIQGDGTLEGNEEALTIYNDSITIDQLRHAVRSAGKMSEQRVPFGVRDESLAGLRDWWSDRLDTWAANQLAGNSAQSDVRYTGLQAASAPDSSHLFAGGGHDTEASLSATTTEALKLSDIDRAVAKAKTFGKQADGSTDGNMPIRPIRVDGGEYYVLFAHPYQLYQLRTDAGTNNWADIQKAAMQGGQITKNPIFTGAAGMYNNTVIHEWTRLPNIVGTPASGTTSDFRRAVFAGAQAACFARGQGGQGDQPGWVEELFDYGNQLGVSGGMIAGLKKSRFNSKDFSTIVISTYAPAP